MFLMVKLDMFVQTFCLFYIVWVHSFGILLTISVFPQSCILRAEYCLSITSLWLNSAEMEEDRVHWQRASALSRRSGCYFLFRDLFKCSVPGATPLSQGCIPCWGFRWPPLPHLAECPALWHALVAFPALACPSLSAEDAGACQDPYWQCNLLCFPQDGPHEFFSSSGWEVILRFLLVFQLS